jgi:hypothetical protein
LAAQAAGTRKTFEFEITFTEATLEGDSRAEEKGIVKLAINNETRDGTMIARDGYNEKYTRGKTRDRIGDRTRR